MLFFKHFLNFFIDGRVFITAVRDEGIPVSVMTVTEIQGEGGPLLRPYPDWSWYRNGCKGITGGVFQIHVSINIFRLGKLYI